MAIGAVALEQAFAVRVRIAVRRCGDHERGHQAENQSHWRVSSAVWARRQTSALAGMRSLTVASLPRRMHAAPRCHCAVRRASPASPCSMAAITAASLLSVRSRKGGRSVADVATPACSAREWFACAVFDKSDCDLSARGLKIETGNRCWLPGSPVNSPASAACRARSQPARMTAISRSGSSAARNGFTFEFDAQFLDLGPVVSLEQRDTNAGIARDSTACSAASRATASRTGMMLVPSSCASWRRVSSGPGCRRPDSRAFQAVIGEFVEGPAFDGPDVECVLSHGMTSCCIVIYDHMSRYRLQSQRITRKEELMGFVTTD